MNIRQYPDPILNRISKPLKKVDYELISIIKAARELMFEKEGIGLSANQIGQPYQWFVTSFEELPFIINPIVYKYGPKKSTIEGCLSLPNIHIKVERPSKIKLTGYDLKGESISLQTDGLLACIIQHEYDHLNGKLIINNSQLSEQDFTSLASMHNSFEKNYNFDSEIKELEELRC